MVLILHQTPSPNQYPSSKPCSAAPRKSASCSKTTQLSPPPPPRRLRPSTPSSPGASRLAPARAQAQKQRRRHGSLSPPPSRQTASRRTAAQVRVQVPPPQLKAPSTPTLTPMQTQIHTPMQVHTRVPVPARGEAPGSGTDAGVGATRRLRTARMRAPRAALRGRRRGLGVRASAIGRRARAKPRMPPSPMAGARTRMPVSTALRLCLRLRQYRTAAVPTLSTVSRGPEDPAVVHECLTDSC